MLFYQRIIKRYSPKKILLFISDGIVLAVGSLLALSIHYTPAGYTVLSPFENLHKLVQYLVLVGVTLFSFRYVNLYKQRVFLSTVEQLIQIIKAVLFSGLLLIIADFFLAIKELSINGRTHLLLFVLFNSTLVSLYRIVLVNISKQQNEINKMLERRILAIGAGDVGSRFADEIAGSSVYYMKLVGFLDDDPSKKGQSVAGLPVLGCTDDIMDIVHEYGIDEIYITIESISYDTLMGLIEKVKETGRQVNMVSSHFGVIERKVDVVEFKELRSVPIFSTISPLYIKVIKRLIDLSVTSGILLVLSPILLTIAALIKLTSRGPVFYKSNVIGKDGEPFTWYKFRTMKADNDQSIHQQHLQDIIRNNKSTEKIKNDPRITAIGRVLRKYSLDELPQLINVMKGDMSLIGPRPCLPYEYEMMDGWQRRRTKVIPGMTGLWQVTGRNRKDVNFIDSMILDLYYADNVSLWLDLRILLKTIPVVIFAKGGS